MAGHGQRESRAPRLNESGRRGNVRVELFAVLSAVAARRRVPRESFRAELRG